MSRLWVLGALVAPVLGGAAASAAPNITIDHAVARVTVVLEPRGDVVAQMVRTNPHFPIQIQRAGDGVSIWGDLGHTSANCHGPADRPHVSVWMRGDVRYDDMPQIVIHAPLNANVRAAGAVYGVVGRGDSLTLSNAGCGDWVVGDQTGALTLNLAGSGDVRAGTATRVDVHTAGSSDVVVRAVRNGLYATVTGSGDVDAGAVSGPLHANIAGSGDVRVKTGQVSDLGANIAGSGDVNFGGVAANVDARIAGSGDITVARVTGAVNKHIVGSGDVTIGR